SRSSRTPTPSGPYNLKVVGVATNKIGQQGSAHRITVKVTVKMESSNPEVFSDASGVEIKMGYQEGQYNKFLGFFPVPALKSGVSFEVAKELIVPHGERHFFKGCVDPNHRNTETNEEDNCGQTSYMAQ
ncbi:MAG: hypothetical protein MUF69_09020, partial [Desulfobacterota bacterium]|nr:hypothetical protein [Thermodesulfobacteriota bacterium]